MRQGRHPPADLLPRMITVLPSRLRSSFGSCQFPTLGFVAERYDAIQRFVRESFWSINLSYTSPSGPETAAPPPHAGSDVDADSEAGEAGDEPPSARGRPRFSDGAPRRAASGGGSVTFSWTRGRLFDFLAAFVLYEMAVSAGAFTVLSVNPHPANRCVGYACPQLHRAAKPATHGHVSCPD